MLHSHKCQTTTPLCTSLLQPLTVNFNAADRYHATYGVRLDPSTQALSLVGSQEGLAHLLMAVADPGNGCMYCMCDTQRLCFASQHQCMQAFLTGLSSCIVWSCPCEQYALLVVVQSPTCTSCFILG